MFATSLHHVQHLREIGRRAARGLEVDTNMNELHVELKMMSPICEWCPRFSRLGEVHEEGRGRARRGGRMKADIE